MITQLLQALENSPPALAIAESAWLFPAFESLHVVAIAIVVGSIFRLDLRMVGLNRGPHSVSEIAAEVLPWVWIAFVVAVASGAAMFASAATRYAENWAFLVKMVVLAMAGINMLTFHLLTERQPEGAPVRTSGVKVAGGLSLLFWIAVVVLGRWIGFL
jgi:hypothetical protein